MLEDDADASFGDSVPCVVCRFATVSEPAVELQVVPRPEEKRIISAAFSGDGATLWYVAGEGARCEVHTLTVASREESLRRFRWTSVPTKSRCFLMERCSSEAAARGDC